MTITSGSDGALWFVGPPFTDVRRSTTSGSMSAFATPTDGYAGTPGSITSGPDGNLWFIVPETPEWIGKMTTSGAVTVYPLPSTMLAGWPVVITSGPDGALWFGAQGVLGRLDPSIPPSTVTPAPQP